MPYGANRNLVGIDTFDGSIDGAWDNGHGDWVDFAWAAGGTIEGSDASDALHGMRRNTGTYANNQYSRGTVSVWSTLTSVPEVFIRCAPGAADESCYYTYGNGFSNEYGIDEADSAFGFTVLGTIAGLVTTAPVILCAEAEGTTIRCGSSENGGADTLRIEVTDATIAAGRPGLGLYLDGTASGVRFTSWEGGNIGAEPHVDSGQGQIREMKKQPMIRGPM